MSARVRAFLFSFQTKLVLAMTGVIVIAILAAGAVFVARDRSESRERALERVAATSPIAYEEALRAIGSNDSEPDFYTRLDEIAAEQGVRILVVSAGNIVLHDTGADLAGTTLEVPAEVSSKYGKGFLSWEAADDAPEPDLVFVAASGQQRRGPFDGLRFGGGEFEGFRIVLAVESDTIADAWRDVLPSLGLAALFGIPLATLAGIVLARQVAQPVRKLTAASEAMAGGDFTQRVEVGREDEVGRLARAFTTMTTRVGQRDQQMRALLANVSHDLKTPMTSITGYAQALTDGTADQADVAHIAQIIGDEAAHVNRLLEDLVYLGEIDAGEVVTRREDVSLEDVLGRCVRRLEPAAEAKEIEIGIDVEKDLLVRNVDPDKIERAITNVLDNATKFTPADGEIMVVARRDNGAAPARVRCSITNSGSVFSEEDLPRIFDRFFRGDRSRRSASGSGLGLAIARELVELNGGRIEAANEIGGGVTFTLSFPD
jgi:signal transduction histidine kinase